MRNTRTRIDALFDQALALPPDERAALLAGERDLRVRREVASLLRAHEDMESDFLDEPAVAPPSPVLAPGTMVARYRIVRVLETGGAGTVYEAEQARPQRRVALKLMRADTRSARARQRFLDEAEFLGRLRHPGVAHIYEAGFFEGGFPFIAMEFVEGERLLDHVRALTTAARLDLFARVCDAVHHGHQQGIVHLDLKPENVLVDAAGQPKVIDFGIARVTDRPAQRELAGTLPYMSPEQCDPSATIDVRSDVYSLGVMLFETLSGALPHDLTGAPFLEATQRIRSGPTRGLASIDRAFAGDLDAIARKALARDREDRYASAAAFADDIRRHLTHHPVEARAPGFLYLLGKFARRRRTAFLALSAVLVVSVAAAIVAGVFAVQKSRAARDAEFQAYIANIAAAAAALRVHDAGEAEQRLARAPHHLRNWEWRHLRQRADRSTKTIVAGTSMRCGAVSAAGDWLVVVDSDLPRHMSIRGWDVLGARERFAVELGPRRPSSVALSPDGGLFAVGYSSGAIELRAEDGAVIRNVEGAHETTVIDIAFSPSGDRFALASRDKTISIWNTRTVECLSRLPGHPDRVICVEWDASGHRLVSGGREGNAILWDVETGAALRTYRGHSKSVEGVALNNKGRLATVSRDLSVRLWDVDTGEAIVTRRVHVSNVRAVTFTHDGTAFVSASWDRTLRVWDSEDGRARGVLRGHHGQVFEVQALNDGRLASLSQDGAAKFWTAVDAPEVLALPHDGTPVAVAFDGANLITAEYRGAIRVWDASTGARLAEARTGRTMLPRLVVDGDDVVVASTPAGVEVRTLPELTVRARFAPLLATFCVNAGRVLTGHYGGRIEIHDLDGKRLHRGRWHQRTIIAAAWSADGSRLATGDETGLVRLWNARYERLAETRTGEQVTALAFAPDGATLAVVAAGRVPELRRVPDLALHRRLTGHNDRVAAAAFTPDGTRLATAGADATVRLWDTASGEQMFVLREHRFGVHAVAFSADGRRLATADGSTEDVLSATRIWNASR